MKYCNMESGRRKGLSSVLSSLSLLCVVLDLQLDGKVSLCVIYFVTINELSVLSNETVSCHPEISLQVHGTRRSP